MVCRQLHDPRRLFCPFAVFPENGCKAFRREDRVDRIFQHPHFIRGRDGKRSSAFSLSDHDGYNRCFQAGHLIDISRNCLSLSSFFCFNSAERSRCINKTDDRAVEFLRLLHQTQRLSVSVRGRHSEIPENIFFCRCAPFLRNDCDRHSVESCDSSDNRLVIFEIPVTVQFNKVGKQGVNIVTSYRAVFSSGDLNPLPGGQPFIWSTLFLSFVLTAFLPPFFPVLFDFMHAKNRCKHFLHLFPLYNLVDETVLQQKFRFLESFRQLLSDRLLNDTRSGKTDQCVRLCQNDIAKHGKTCRYSAGCRISQDRNIEKPGITVLFQSRRCLCHLHQGDNAFLHSCSA